MYAPVIVVRRYDKLCSDTGEPFVPMTVDPVLGNPEVALRQVGNGDPVIKWAPTAKDLYGRGQGVYLDFAGEALRPGCVYATDSARYTPPTQSGIYAHIAQQPDRPGFLAVQYWIYWYYNDWNNKHESDWEFIQVLFRASSVEQALTQDPISVGYAQHEGGEASNWTSDKLEKDGTHPVVYSSQRSHASYVQAAQYLGRGASEGFGCDNTQRPSTRLRPRVVVLPDAPGGPDDPFAWLAFNGRWGERQSGRCMRRPSESSPLLTKRSRTAHEREDLVSGEDIKRGRALSLRTARLEAFSDGVFAIAITLLVLEISVPAGSEEDLLSAVLDEWPSYLAYFVSFASVGAIWLAHTAVTEYLDHADRWLMRLNLLLLLFVSFLPFPTKLLAESVNHEDAGRVATTIYGLTLLITAVVLSAV
jgi:hypothetical protein